MLYCPSCLEEYEDGVKACSDCKTELVTEETLAQRPEFRRLREDEDARDFIVIGPAEDPFEADAFVAAISEAGIPVLARNRRTSSVDALQSIQHSWWEILVPSDQREKAVEVMARRRVEIEESEADAERAAEEEEAEDEAAEAEAAAKKA